MKDEQMIKNNMKYYYNYHHKYIWFNLFNILITPHPPSTHNEQIVRMNEPNLKDETLVIIPHAPAIDETNSVSIMINEVCIPSFKFSVDWWSIE